MASLPIRFHHPFIRFTSATNMPNLVDTIRENYLHTLDRIATAARKSNRQPDDVRLVVVTKSQPLEVVQAAIEAGRVFSARITLKKVLRKFNLYHRKVR